MSDVTATSTRPPEGGVRFDAAHLVDGNPSSVWCSGPVADPPPSVTFAIPEGCRIHGASILSGHVGHPGKLVDNGRAAEIELSAGRLRGAAEIDDPVGLELNAKQLITKPATLFAGWEAYAVDRLTVTFTQIHRGTQHPGVCLSELRPILAGRPTAK